MIASRRNKTGDARPALDETSGPAEQDEQAEEAEQSAVAPQGEADGRRDGWMSAQELLAHVVFSTLLPAAQLTAETGLSLRDVKHLAELATYKELKAQQLTMKEICDRIGVSMGKVGLLSRQLKDHFSRPDSEYGLARRLLMLLWAGPRSEAELLQACVDAESSAVLAALAETVADGLVVKMEGRTPRYRLSDSRYRLREEQPWMGRLDALNHLMSAVAQLIWTRFFHKDESAFSRTLSFRARPEDLERLRQVYEEHVFPLVAAIDESATGAGDEGLPVTLSMFWSPDHSGSGPENE